MCARCQVRTISLTNCLFSPTIKTKGANDVAIHQFDGRVCSLPLALGHGPNTRSSAGVCLSRDTVRHKFDPRTAPSLPQNRRRNLRRRSDWVLAIYGRTSYTPTRVHRHHHLRGSPRRSSPPDNCPTTTHALPNTLTPPARGDFFINLQ